MTTDPTALIITWLRSIIYGAGRTTPVSVRLDPDRGFPQLVVTAARPRIPTLPNGVPDPARVLIDVSVYGAGKGGDNPDYAAAWDALRPVTAAAQVAHRTRWTAATGETVYVVQGLTVTTSTEAASGAAIKHATFTVGVLLP